ncbi:hypothetical protein SAMN02745866_01141 [Alteromonadaceae bacterium Bs31]|nr:hypothetical protein SAMN02745866_01141 [Alteromonadaceae bacterium Bs31]
MQARLKSQRGILSHLHRAAMFFMDGSAALMQNQIARHSKTYRYLAVLLGMELS